MQRLREKLAAVFPEECFLQGTHIEEKGRIFSIRPDAGEAVIGVKLSPLRQRWPNGKGICDGLFVCVAPNCNHLIVTLVELKGSDVAKAMSQIEDSCLLLCKGANPVLEIHCDEVSGAAMSMNRSGHGRGVLGVIVAKIGLAQNQKKKSTLWTKHKLRIWIVTGKLQGIRCAELAGKFTGSN